MKYELNDIVVLKKNHPCGDNRFEIVRLGVDIKIKCVTCGHIIMIPRVDLNKRVKKVIKNEKEKEN